MQGGKDVLRSSECRGREIYVIMRQPISPSIFSILHRDDPTQDDVITPSGV